MNLVPIAVFVVFMAIVFVSVCLSAFARRRVFNNRFPPINDDEFIERCGPGVNPDIAIRVRRIVANSLDVEYKRVYPEQSLVDDLGWD